jgi:hypothetical protein
MSLKNINHEDRILFLQLFMREVVNTVIEKKIVRKRVDTEKLRQKFITKEVNPHEAMRQLMSQPMPKPKTNQPTQITQKQSPAQNIQNQKPTQIKQEIKPTKPVPKIQKEVVRSIVPQPDKRPAGFGLGKIEALLKDKSIQAIECTGPGKNILIKRYNKINASGLILPQDEISLIIKEFSKQAKIPIIGGLFKAAVGNLIISAVISDFVGSRFIINKMSPYSMIYKK